MYSLVHASWHFIWGSSLVKSVSYNKYVTAVADMLYFALCKEIVLYQGKLPRKLCLAF